MRREFLFLLFIALSPGLNPVYGQEDAAVQSPGSELPHLPPLPANLTLYNTGISLFPQNVPLFDVDDYFRVGKSNKFIPDLYEWQKNYISRNNLRNIPADATLINGRAMEFALLVKNPTNQEFYLTNVLMNQISVSNTQLQRMNVRMRSIRYVDFIGVGKLGATYITTPGYFDRQNYPFK